jgi:Ubiquitin-binding domain
VEGDAEMWAALRVAADAARGGGDGAALAPELLGAAGLTPASAKRPCLTKVYDERGGLYLLPAYALRDPENLGEVPVCEEFKDAATVVQDLEKAGESGNAAAPARGRRQ